MILLPKKGHKNTQGNIALGKRHDNVTGCGNLCGGVRKTTTQIPDPV